MKNNNHCIKTNEIEFGTEVIIKYLVNRVDDLQEQVDTLKNKMNVMNESIKDLKFDTKVFR